MLAALPAAAARPYLGSHLVALGALPAAAARPYLGAWVRNDSLAPTFDRRLLSYAPHFHVCRGVLSRLRSASICSRMLRRPSLC